MSRGKESKNRVVVGSLCLLGTCVVWVGSSYVTQFLIRKAIHPLLLALICSSTFCVLLPCISLRRYITQRQRRWAQKDQAPDSTDGLESMLDVNSSLSGADSADTPLLEHHPLGKLSLIRQRQRDWHVFKAAMLVTPMWFLAQASFAQSLAYTSVASNTILSSTSTLFTLLGSWCLLKEPPTLRTSLGVLLCIAGVAAITMSDAASQTGALGAASDAADVALAGSVMQPDQGQAVRWWVGRSDPPAWRESSDTHHHVLHGEARGSTVHARGGSWEAVLLAVSSWGAVLTGQYNAMQYNPPGQYSTGGGRWRLPTSLPPIHTDTNNTGSTQRQHRGSQQAVQKQHSGSTRAAPSAEGISRGLEKHPRRPPPPPAASHFPPPPTATPAAPPPPPSPDNPGGGGGDAGGGGEGGGGEDGGDDAGSNPPVLPVLGDALAVLSAALYALYTVVMRKKLQPYDDNKADSETTALFFGYIGLLALGVLLPLWVVGVVDAMPFIMVVTPCAFALACLQGLLDYVLADFLWARAVLLLSPLIATAGLTLQIPLAAAIDALLGRAAWAHHKESCALFLVGAVAVVAGFLGCLDAGSWGVLTGCARRQWARIRGLGFLGGEGGAAAGRDVRSYHLVVGSGDVTPEEVEGSVHGSDEASRAGPPHVTQVTRPRSGAGGSHHTMAVLESALLALRAQQEEAAAQLDGAAARGDVFGLSEGRGGAGGAGAAMGAGMGGGAGSGGGDAGGTLARDRVVRGGPSFSRSSRSGGNLVGMGEGLVPISADEEDAILEKVLRRGPGPFGRS